MTVAKKRAKRPEGDKVDFEAALTELEAIVHDLEDGEIGLSDSLARYEKGVKLLRQCYGMLDGAQRKIELLTAVDSEGRPVVEPIDDTELTLTEKADRRSRRRSTSSGGQVDNDGGDARGDDVDVPENIS
jgi:exodeoxyribonuclease VII small subunit